MIKVLGVPFHYGQSSVSVASAPDLLRSNGLIERLLKFDHVKDLGNISFKNLDEKKDKISLASHRIMQEVLREEPLKDFLLSIGGDHGMSLGVISGLLKIDPERVVIWVDAHGDINTPESSLSKNFHGMPLSYLLGLSQDPDRFPWISPLLRPEKLIYFGPRDLDPFERDLIRDLGIQCFSSADMNEYGARDLLEKALKLADPLNSCNIHVSFDLDVFDANDFTSTGIPLQGGPRVSEMMNLAAGVSSTKRLKSMDLVEYHPQDMYEDNRLIFSLLNHIFE